MVNLYIYYTLNQWSRDLNTDFTLGNCLFGCVKLTKNADLNKYDFFGYDIGFDSCSELLFTDGSKGNMSLFELNEHICAHW